MSVLVQFYDPLYHCFTFQDFQLVPTLEEFSELLGISVLVHFYDPLYHCFTFQDYQLVPTLEEFFELLGIYVLEQTPFTGWEKTLRPEEIVAALHLTKEEVMAN